MQERMYLWAASRQHSKHLGDWVARPWRGDAWQSITSCMGAIHSQWWGPRSSLSFLAAEEQYIFTLAVAQDFFKSQGILLRRNAGWSGHENVSLCFLSVSMRWCSGQLFLFRGEVVWLMFHLGKDKVYSLVHLFIKYLLSPCLIREPGTELHAGIWWWAGRCCFWWQVYTAGI